MTRKQNVNLLLYDNVKFELSYLKTYEGSARDEIQKLLPK